MATLLARGPFASVDDFFDEADRCGCLTLDEVTNAAMVADALDRASDILARLSGMRFLGQKVVELWRPTLPCGPCDRTCIQLPADLLSVEAVWDDGVLLAEDGYMVYGGKLYRIGGNFSHRSFSGQNVFAPHTEKGTVAVSFTVGQVAGWSERAALWEVACDLINAWLGNRPSALEGVTSISGGGVSITREAGEDEAQEAFSSFPAVARFTAFWNPRGDAVPSAVYSPDVASECGPRSCC